MSCQCNQGSFQLCSLVYKPYNIFHCVTAMVLNPLLFQHLLEQLFKLKKFRWILVFTVKNKQKTKSFCVPVGSTSPGPIGADEHKQHHFPKISGVTERKKQGLGDSCFSRGAITIPHLPTCYRKKGERKLLFSPAKHVMRTKGRGSISSWRPSTLHTT